MPKLKLPKEYIKRNNKLKKKGFKSYDDFLQSDLWKRIKKTALNNEPGGNCFFCNKPCYTLHHVSYNKVTTSTLCFLLPVCRVCHDLIHATGSQHSIIEATKIYAKELGIKERGLFTKAWFSKFWEGRKVELEEIPRKVAKQERPVKVSNRNRHDFLIDYFFGGYKEGYEAKQVGEWVLVKFLLNGEWSVAVYTKDSYKFKQ